MSQIHKSAWLLVLLSAALQILIFPLPNLYMLSWVAITPLLIAILRARPPKTLQLQAGIKLLPASPLQAFVLAYACGILWYAGTCYWIYSVMHQYGGVNAPARNRHSDSVLPLPCALPRHLRAARQSARGKQPTSICEHCLLSPVVWVAVELARTRITGFPWGLLGTTQVDNIPLARIASVTGVYGLSFEIMLVNAALAAAFLVEREKRKRLLLATVIAALILQAGSLVPCAYDSRRTVAAILVQANVPILEGVRLDQALFQRHVYAT